MGYFSKKLTRCQKNYSTIQKELLALVLAVQHCEVYISSGPGDLLVFTDHNPLVFLERFKTTSDRLFRWSLHVIADALSRS